MRVSANAGPGNTADTSSLNKQTDKKLQTKMSRSHREIRLRIFHLVEPTDVFFHPIFFIITFFGFGFLSLVFIDIFEIDQLILYLLK